MCLESKNPFRNFRLWKPSQAILQAHCVIDVILLREVGALADDLPNRIIDIHHGMHGRNLSLPEIAGKRQKGDRTRSVAPIFEFGRRFAERSMAHYSTGAASFAQRKPTWLLPVSGGVPRLAEGR